MNEGVVRAADALQSPWLLVAYFAMFAILAWCNMLGPQKMRLYLATAIMMRPLHEMSVRNEISWSDRILLALTLIAVLNLALFGYQTGVISGRLSPEFRYFLIIFAATFGLLILSWLIPRFLIAIFGSGSSEMALTTQNLLQVVVFGLLFLPLNLMMTYAPLDRGMLVWGGIILLVIFLIFRWLKEGLAGLSLGVSALYIVLYLCAAEILPTLIGLNFLDIQSLLR